MSIKEYSPVLDEDYKKIAQLEYALDDEVCCEDKTFEHILANNAINLNYKFPETSFIQVNKPDGLIGGTILHASLIYLEHGRVENLIKHGADITVKNADGSTVVHLKAKKVYEDYLHSWKTESYSNFCHSTNSLLSAHINFNIAANPSNNHGISHFHIACMANNVDVVKFFLEKGSSVNETVSQDSPILPSFTPLHFAAKYCALEVVEFLLKHGADVHFKDAKGMSPLLVLIDERLKIFIQLRRTLCCKYSSSKTDYRNLRMYYDKNEKIILSLLNESSFGFTRLHALCTFVYTSMVESFLIDNDVDLDRSLELNSPLCPGYTALHFAAHFNPDTVRLLLRKGANMKIKDARGTTAFDICLQNLYIQEICSFVMIEPNLQSITFSDDKTKLSSLIHAMQHPKTFAHYLKTNVKDINMFVPTNSPFSLGNTPLHFASSCTEIPSIHWDPEYTDRPPRSAFRGDSSGAETEHYLDRIQVCLDLGADVTLKNHRGFTPLHLAFRSQAGRAVKLMSRWHLQTCNPVDVDGLSHLHIASAAKDHELVGKLLTNGANVNGTTNCGFTVRPHFVKSNSTPLHFAVVVKCPRTVKTLIDNGANVLAKDTEGATPLERFFYLPTFSGIRDMRWFHITSYSAEETEVVELLLRRVAAEIVDGKESPKRLLECLRILEKNLLMSIMKCNDAALKKIFNSVGITELHVACLLRNNERIVTNTNVDAQVDLDSPFWAGFTPLHVAVKYEGDDDIARMLLDRGADVTVRNAEHGTPLHVAFAKYRGDPGECRKFDSTKLVIVDAMLGCQKDFSVNPVDVSGTSHFHIACARNNLTAVNEFLRNGVDVDQAMDYFDKGFTALHFAAQFLQMETIEILITREADVQWRTAGGDSLLHTCFNIPPPNDKEFRMTMKSRREKALDILISAGIEVNARNMFGQTILTLLMKTDHFTPADILDYLKRGCHVDVYDVDGQGLMAACLMKVKNFATYLTIFCELANTRIDESGRNDIHNVVSFKRPWPVIPIEDAFVPVENYTRVVEKLICCGSDVDKQDNKGLTPLHLAAKLQNITGIVGLLENGADVNVTDANGKTALDYSFEVATNSEGNVRDLDEQIFKIFAVRAYKHQMVGLELSKRVEKVLRKVRQQYSFRISISKCLREIWCLEERRIEPYGVTLFDFLSETGAVAAYPIMLEAQRHAVDEFFRAGELWRSYPEWSCLLCLQYRKAVARMKLIDSATNSLRFLVGFDIPDVCSKAILRFLSNGDLRNLSLCLRK